MKGDENASIIKSSLAGVAANMSNIWNLENGGNQA